MQQEIVKSQSPLALLSNETASPLQFDIREIYAAIYRARYLLAGIFAACLALAVAITLLTTRLYEGAASVEVRQEAEKVLGTEADQEGASSKVDVERFLDTQVDLVKSRRVTAAVASELRLYNLDFLNSMKVQERAVSNEILTPEERRRELVIETLLENLDVAFTGRTRILTIRFVSPDPRLSAKIANSYAENYIESNLERKSDSSTYALRFLRQQLQEAQARLEQSERDALEYARRTRIVDVSNAANRAGGGSEPGRPQSLITARLVQLNEQYAEAVASKIEAQERWLRVRDEPLLNLTEVLSNQAIQGLLEQRALLDADYKQQLETRQEDFPAVRQAAAKLREVNRQINSLATNIKNSVRGQYEIARQQEGNLKSELDSLKSNTLIEQNQTIQLSILRREAETNRLQYEAILRRFNQLNAESGVQANNISFVDPAVPQAKPTSPRLVVNLALAVALAFVLSVIYMLVQSRLLDKVRTAFDVVDRLRLPLLGAVPKTTNVIEQMADVKSEAAEAFNLIRASVLLTADGALPKSLAFTSVTASEGKTSSCVSLAISLSRIGVRVLLCDLDLRRPNVHKQLGLSNAKGMSNLLGGQARSQDTVQASQYENLSVITSGPIPQSPTDLIVSSNFAKFLDELSDEFDCIVLDCPPVLALADAEMISARVSRTVFIVESGKNSPRAIMAGIDRITNGGGRVGGIVLTKYDAESQGYGGYSEYSYVYKYESSDKND